jgi:dihydrodiol dehydrogenase / D-xylose 1-dehydrogenase (NADP)
MTTLNDKNDDDDDNNNSSNNSNDNNKVRHVHPDVPPVPMDVVLRRRRLPKNDDGNSDGNSDGNGNGNGNSSTSQDSDASLLLLLDCPPLQWGILGCGRVSHDWCLALQHLPSQRVVACATSSSSTSSSSDDDSPRARQFAALHNIPAYYQSYEQLCEDPNVHIVYVGNVHSTRREVVELCLKHDKHVLVEKPFAMNSHDAEYLIRLAADKPHLFVTEGMWTRYFPAVQHARNLIQQGAIGDVCTVLSDFNINAADHEEYPTSFFYQPQLGGGATLLVGPYPVAAAILAFGGRMPTQIKAVGQVDNHTGVDLHATLVLGFDPPAADADGTNDTVPSSPAPKSSPVVPGAGTATLTYGILCESEEVTTIIGTRGRITIMTPSHNPTAIKLEIKGHGRGSVAGPPTVYHYPLPEDTPEIRQRGGFNYPNSAGFCYEAAAVARCIRDLEHHHNNKNEEKGAGSAAAAGAPQYPLSETLVVMKILDEVQRQIRQQQDG